MNQLVSILIPAFNAEKWIRESIESALAQTWPWKEIIVVDDGSKDATFEIAQKYSSPYVKVVTRVNRGASAARNHALSLARGDYIQWLDADDLLARDKIAKQLEEVESSQSSDVLMTCAWGKFYTYPERARFLPNSLWVDLDPVEWLFRKIDRNEWMAIETWLVSRKLTELAGPWNEGLSRDQDGEYFCRVISKAKKIQFIPEARVFVRVGISGKISSNDNLTEQKLKSILIALELQIKTLIAAENSERTRRACIRFLNRWLKYFYPDRHELLERMRILAEELGSGLETPLLPIKYRWIQRVFGWSAAKRSQQYLRYLKTLACANWERLFYRTNLENHI